MKRSFLFALLVLTAPAQAHDWGAREGEFHNESGRTLYCFADHGSTVGMEELPPRGVCWADAVGTGVGHAVFKIPNRTVFMVSARSVRAGDVRSRVLLVLAKLRHGSDRYGVLGWEHFLGVMGHKPLEVM